MTRTMTILHTNGKRTVKTLPEGTRGELDEMQKAVGGSIELVPYFDHFEGEPCEVYCNEEGKIHGLPFNDEATSSWYLNGYDSDVLVGDVIIIQPPEA